MGKTRTRIVSLALTLVMLLGLLPGTALAAEAEEISSAEEFAAMEPEGNYILMDDITITEPYGDSGYPFQGTFDGNGHTITLHIQAQSTYQAAFAKCDGAQIKNLVVKGDIQTTLGYAAGITAHITGGSITNCGAEVTITCSGTNSTNFGGITGYANGTTITNCYSSSDISGKIKNAGGIVGQIQSGAVTIENCYNLGNITSTGTSAVRAGGIVGNGNKGSVIRNCYTAGKIDNSVQSGAFAGYLNSDFTLENCYYLEGAHDQACGFVYGSDTSAIISRSDEELKALASDLGEAYIPQEDGYPILSWQAGEPPVPKDPHITLAGTTTLYQTNSGAQPTATLRVSYVDMDDTPVTWSLVSGEDVVELATPDDVGANNDSVIVQALAPGYATVQAQAGEYTAETEIAVYPFVTTVAIEGTVAVGQTVRAKVNVLGGGEYDYDLFPALKIQWKYLSQEDYLGGNTANYQDIPSATNLSYTIPDDMAGGYLSFRLWYNGEEKTPGSAKQIAATVPEPEPPIEEPEPPHDDLADAVAALGEWYKMYPVYGTDTNVTTMLKSDLSAKGFEGIDVAVKDVEGVYGNAAIADDGGITYFYADPNTAPAVRMGSYLVTFTLSKDEASLDYGPVSVIVYWDADKVKETMRDEILSQVQLDSVADADLSLPRAVDGKLWTLISWTSSDESAISISGKNQSTADTLFDPYVGVVTPGEVDKTVTLTATFTFQLTNDVTGQEAPIVLYKVFTVTVPALEKIQAEQIRRELLAKLDQGFGAKGLTDAVTGRRLEPDGDGVYTVLNDVQLPTTRDFSVDGKYYPVTITSDNNSLVQAPDVANAARVTVLRPGVGQSDGMATITVTIADKDTDITASRSFPLRVPALTQAEVDRELALMERVKAAYFDGIKGENTAKDDVRTDLSPFREVYEDETGDLIWVRDIADQVGHGIVPTPIDGWEDLELWRLFRSSNPNVISHENLLVTRQSEAKAVNVTSFLSSETLGRYGQLYQSDPVTYAQYAGLAGLYYQQATTDDSTVVSGQAALLSAADPMIVRGTKDPDSAAPVVETLVVSFVLTGLDGEVWIDATTYTDLDEAFTVYDVFTRALTDKGYTAVREKGTYIVSVSGPQGALTEKQHGERSGWMYRVNGVISEVYMGGHPLHDGDKIQVFYTRDASVDDPDWTWPSDDPVDDSTDNPTDTPSKPGQSRPSGRRDETTDSQDTQETQPDQVVAPASQTFSDVEADSWYESGVTFVVGRGLFRGVADGCFAPETHMTRAMLMTVLARLDGQDTSGGENWYQAGMDWAVEKGVSDGTAPDDHITREQLAVMLYRYARALGLPTAGRDSLRSFADSDQVSDWARDAVAWAVDCGIIHGTSAGTLTPAGPATRAEVATMLHRFVTLMHL